ncbi:FAD-dependent monooxygenase [Actinoalloteichus spitiensis]|uniref:FAD-dependent monooxygenase n=1 Tax=Actinoalloteichus spitiensis TaxID=252394 RepID=UPI00315D52B2
MRDVIVVAAGPTGVWLATELALHGVDAVVLERDPEPTRAVGALGLHARSIEVLAQRGVADRFLDAGQTTRWAGTSPASGNPRPNWTRPTRTCSGSGRPRWTRVHSNRTPGSGSSD